MLGLLTCPLATSPLSSASLMLLLAFSMEAASQSTACTLVLGNLAAMAMLEEALPHPRSSTTPPPSSTTLQACGGFLS